MSPITHFLISWGVADTVKLSPRDRALVTLAGVAPDLDGLPVLVDLGARLLGRPDPFLYGQYHHMLTHGLPAAIVLALLAGLSAVARVRTGVLAFLVIHLHLLCDLVGSRGPSVDDIWPLSYLAPLSTQWMLTWSGQWALNAWPNVLLTLAFLVLALARATKRGYSPLGLVSSRADAVFVATLRARFHR